MTEPTFEAEDLEVPAPVQEALDGLDVLDERPVAEHVAVFEQTHERLRRALDGHS